MLVELEGSTDVSKKEREHFVEELIVRMILQCKAHEIGEMLHEFIRWIHPNKSTSRGIRTEALLTGNSKCDSNIAVALTLRHQESDIFLPGSITFVVTFNKTMDAILNLA